MLFFPSVNKKPKQSTKQTNKNPKAKQTKKTCEESKKETWFLQWNENAIVLFVGKKTPTSFFRLYSLQSYSFLFNWLVQVWPISLTLINLHQHFEQHWLAKENERERAGKRSYGWRQWLLVTLAALLSRRTGISLATFAGSPPSVAWVLTVQ